jgi:hypothetical protein
MAWFKKIPWLSILLLLITYGAFGWLFGSWAIKLIEQKVFLAQLEHNLGLIILYLFGDIGILLLAIAFTAPISLITISLNSWLKSDTRGFLSILIGAFIFTIIVQRIDYFAKGLVLIAAALLLKLDLQLAGCNRWLSLWILTIFCWLGFTGGILAFYIWVYNKIS